MIWGWVPDDFLCPLFWGLLILSVLGMFGMFVIGKPLKTSAAPRGILSFQLAKTKSRAQAMVASWNPAARRRALLSLKWDYLYILIYVPCLSLSCHIVGTRLNQGGLGNSLAAGVLVAGLFDCLENWALLRVLAVGASDSLAKTGWIAASLKFTLVIIAVLFCVVGFAVMIVS